MRTNLNESMHTEHLEQDLQTPSAHHHHHHHCHRHHYFGVEAALLPRNLFLMQQGNTAGRKSTWFRPLPTMCSEAQGGKVSYTCKITTATKEKTVRWLLLQMSFFMRTHGETGARLKASENFISGDICTPIAN